MSLDCICGPPPCCYQHEAVESLISLRIYFIVLVYWSVCDFSMYIYSVHSTKKKQLFILTYLTIVMFRILIGCRTVFVDSFVCFYLWLLCMLLNTIQCGLSPLVRIVPLLSNHNTLWPPLD